MMSGCTLGITTVFGTVGCKSTCKCQSESTREKKTNSASSERKCTESTVSRAGRWGTTPPHETPLLSGGNADPSTFCELLLKPKLTSKYNNTELMTALSTFDCTE